jgi:hypothetical protein
MPYSAVALVTVALTFAALGLAGLLIGTANASPCEPHAWLCIDPMQLGLGGFVLSVILAFSLTLMAAAITMNDRRPVAAASPPVRSSRGFTVDEDGNVESVPR